MGSERRCSLMPIHWKECAEVCVLRKINDLGCHNCIYRGPECEKVISAYRVKSPYEMLKNVKEKENEQ